MSLLPCQEAPITSRRLPRDAPRVCNHPLAGPSIRAQLEGNSAATARPRVLAMSMDRIGIEFGKGRLAIDPPEDLGVGSPVLGWLFLSSTEEKIVRLLLAASALSREEIASRIDENADGRLKGILAGLVGRHVIAPS